MDKISRWTKSGEGKKVVMGIGTGRKEKNRQIRRWTKSSDGQKVVPDRHMPRGKEYVMDKSGDGQNVVMDRKW